MGDFGLLDFTENGGIISSNGENWREQRRISLSILRDFGMGKASMEEKIRRSLQTLTDHLDGLESTAEVSLQAPIQVCSCVQ